MPESDIRDEFLDFWIANNLNVLFIGHYGTGKTTRILEAFNRANLKYKYFSTATMDPWCDFVGIPKVVEENGKRYLDYILPKDFQDDCVEAIFMDEYNRSHKKVRNAVMELMQFKSINGRKFNKLKVVWAAINPEDEGDYQVEPLDKAQKDRFEIQVQVPYEPSIEFYTRKFNESQAKTIISWWKDLSEEQKMEVSPRRMEYALKIYNMKGNLKHVLPHSCNPSRLNSMLRVGPAEDNLKKFFENDQKEEAKKYLLVENNYATAVKFFTSDVPNDVDNNNWRRFFLPIISTEKLTSLISDDEIFDYVVKNIDVPIFKRVIEDVWKTNTNKSLVKKITKNSMLVPKLGSSVSMAEKSYYGKYPSKTIQWSDIIKSLMTQPLGITQQRVAVYAKIVDGVPQVLLLNEAVSTLEFLDIIVSHCHATTVSTLPHFIGIVNHCIEQIHMRTGFDYTTIMANYGQKMRNIFGKLGQLNADHKLLRPVKGDKNAIAKAVGGN